MEKINLANLYLIDKDTYERIRLIMKALEDGVLKIKYIKDADEVVCDYGFDWFYFLPMEDKELTTPQLNLKYSTGSIGYAILRAIEELEDDEYDYLFNLIGIA